MKKMEDKKAAIYVINEEFEIVYLCDELKSVIQENSWKNNDIVRKYTGNYQKCAKNSGGG